MTDLNALADRCATKIAENDPYLIDYLLSWAGLGDEQPWGAAYSFALEMGSSYRVIAGESDPTVTPLGKEVAKALRARAMEDE